MSSRSNCRRRRRNHTDEDDMTAARALTSLQASTTASASDSSAPVLAVATSSSPSSATSSSSTMRGCENADDILGQHVLKKTRTQYADCVKFITNYCSNHIPDAVDENGKLKLPMDLEHLKRFLGDMGAERSNKTIKAASTMDAYGIALKFIYKENGIAIPASTNIFLKTFKEGYKRKVAQKKDIGDMKAHEGKVALTYPLYQKLCAYALFSPALRSTYSGFLHLFLVMCWNLFARSCSVAQLRTNHMYWANDCLVVDFSLHKGDQAGERITPKHVFANPYHPEVCPILALALHVFCMAFRAENEDKNKLFTGTPYDIFSKWLPTALGTIDNLGYSIGDFGTHSCRKGIASYCAGFIGGPSVISIFLRAGWSLGQVQDRYISNSEGGDHLTGRVACGLNFNDGEQFSVLPPTFKKSSVLSKDDWVNVIPCYTDFPIAFQACLPHLLASLVYHWDWINEKNDAGKLLVNTMPCTPQLP